jgi:hypothetical protein
MPDVDHWSASMLLRWVLTRDRDAVVSMVNHYGGRWLVEGDNVTRIPPQTWDDVIRAYSIDESLSKEERVAEAVVKAELFVAPALKAVYSALRRGEIVGWARPNGSGDIAEIHPLQWTGLLFHALEGHDIAVPVDSERNLLHLPRPLPDYLSGSVPATSAPTVWPDPQFPAEQALRLWPPRAVVEVSLAPPEPHASPNLTTSWPTASYEDVKNAVMKRGAATEGELQKAAREALPNKRVPRKWVRQAREQLFGKPSLGRPKGSESP